MQRVNDRLETDICKLLEISGLYSITEVDFWFGMRPVGPIINFVSIGQTTLATKAADKI